jgi:6-phosphogluconolactonase
MMESVPALPDGVGGDGHSGADVHVRPDGKFLYSSNRGHDSIAIFAIDAVSGELAVVGHQDCGGSIPRNFSIDPSGELLLVGNQESHTVAVFRIDADAGTLTPLGSTPTSGEPHWVGVVTLPAR